MGRTFSLFVILLLLAATVWIVGFIWFIGEVPRYSTKNTSPQNEKADIGVVLTGGQGRITHGLIMLYEKRTPLLFISGVNEDVSDKELFAKSGNVLKAKLYKLNKHKVVLGRKAHSTHGNALEVKDFLEERNRVKSILLITTNYHMPRSMYEFSHALPNLKIIGEPVFSPKFPANWWQNKDSILLLISEYHKFIISNAIRTTMWKTKLSEVIANNPI